MIRLLQLVAQGILWLVAVVFWGLLIILMLTWPTMTALGQETDNWNSCLSVNADGTQVGDVENGEITATFDGTTATFTLLDGTVIEVSMARVSVGVCEDGSIWTEEYTQAEIDEGLAEPEVEIDSAVTVTTTTAATTPTTSTPETVEISGPVDLVLVTKVSLFDGALMQPGVL